MSRPFMQAMRAAALLLASASIASVASAQDAGADPSARVARLAETQGQVWVYAPESGDWVGAERNQVLTTGYVLATDAGSRAELQVGSATVRLDAGAEIGVALLDDDHLVLRLQQGAAIVRLRDGAAANPLELDSDQGRIVALRAGTYRIGEADGRSDVTVYAGEARYEGPNSALTLDAGQRAQFWIDAAGVAQYGTLAPANDDFLAWSAERDRRELSVLAERYVSPEMTGETDLDSHGRWEQSEDNGPVWIPTVAADWAPYSQGQWAWVYPWGWTWVDEAPWGFAPFHYGRWAHWHDNWCWVPGTRVARPVYAPALVGWVGGPRGNGGGAAVVGWVPLGPREVYVPGYPVSSRYAERINISYVGNADLVRSVFGNPQAPRDFQNRHVPRAITVVPASVMAERRPVGPASAEYRQAAWVRDLSNGPARSASLPAPPVATSVASRAPSLSALQPPPGFPARPAGDLRPAPVPSPRDRSPNDRDRDVRESHDPMRPGRVPAAPGSTTLPSPPSVSAQMAYPTGAARPSYPAPTDAPAFQRVLPAPPLGAQAAQPAPNMHALPVYRPQSPAVIQGPAIQPVAPVQGVQPRAEARPVVPAAPQAPGQVMR